MTIQPGRLPLPIRFIFQPYFNRVRSGEGGLVVFNLIHSVFAHGNDWAIILMESVLSFLVMCALYGFNDYHDRRADILNGRKDQEFVRRINAHAGLFLSLNMALAAATVLGTFLFLERSKLAVILALYLVNAAYSIFFKSIPLLDILSAILWGGLFALLAGDFSWQLGLIVGVMTGIAHLFQIATDRGSDARSIISTTAVAMPGMETALLAGLCLLLGAALSGGLGVFGALSSLFPLAIYRWSGRIALSWHMSRAYFFICWLLALRAHYGVA